MHTNTKYLLILACISVIFFFFSGFVVDSSLESKESTAIELISPKDSIYRYNSSHISPFKYRVLFSSIVKSTYDILKGNSEDNDIFYYTYVSVMAVTYICAILAFYYLLLTIGFSTQLAFFGSTIFLLSPSILFAFSIPVHSREDFLGYLILCLGLISILENRVWLVLIFCVLGVLCRETLLILPFLYLFFKPEAKITHRFLVAIVSFITFFLIRFFAGYESYDVLGLGLFYNLNNIIESLGFIFLSFSFMWIFFLIDTYNNNFRKRRISNKNIQFFRDSAIWVFILVFLSTLVGGRFNEIRLMNLLFPWMIIIFLIYFQDFYFVVKKAVKKKRFIFFSLSLMIVLISFIIPILNKVSSLFPKRAYYIPYENWIIITFIYLYIFTITLFLISQVLMRPDLKERYEGKIIQNL